MEVAQGELFDQLGGVGKGMAVFSGKSDKDISTDGRLRHPIFYGQDLLPEKVVCVRAMHSFQDRIVATLQRKMKMGAEDVRRCHEVYDRTV